MVTRFQLHLVHWKRSAYPSPNVAAGEGDGLAVLGLFVDVGEEDNPEFAKLIPYLEKVTHCGEKVPIQEEIDPSKFLPNKDHRRMWHYEGSLTTPPLLESVLWIVFQNPIKISAEQVIFKLVAFFEVFH